LKREIEDTRAALGDTAEVLAHKADVKERSREKVEDVKERSREKVEEGKERLGQLQESTKAGARSAAEQARERPTPIGAAVAALLGLLGLRRLLRRRKNRKGSRRRKR
jgi:ElaB/YqjD/DUF883 family membrane-anchored ribosome-binding protein